MATNYNSSVVTNGLVMYYDMSNTQKSWKGAPAINLVTNPTYEANPNATGNEFVQWGDLAPIFNTYGTTGVVYSLSFDLKSKIAGPVRAYMQNGSATKYAFVNQDVNATTEYQRFTINGLSASIQNGAETLAMLAFYGVYGTGRIASIKNVQVEINPFATPFINGTRTNTQSVLDLTNNNTLTATSLTYDANNTFSFNGSTSIVTVPDSDNFSFPSHTFAFDYWVNFNNTTSLNGIIGKGEGSWEYAIYSNGTNGLIFYTWPVNGAGPVYTPITTTFVANQWYHHCWTADGVNHYLYINGALTSTAGKGVSYNMGNGSGRLTIGAAGDGGGLKYLNGKLSTVKIYNRSLSASEVSQNFNALRGRFGI